MRRQVILFDGVCNLCNSFVLFVIRRDKKKRFMFASLQSNAATELLINEIETPAFKTVILIKGNRIYKKSTAALRILKQLSGLWPLLYGLIIVPPFIRDAVYDFVARNRYKWFGRRNRCMVPTDDLKKKFLEYDSEQENISSGSK